MKKYKLRNWVKVVITLLLLVIGYVTYLKIGTLGELAQTDRGYRVICVGAWFWLLSGQFTILSLIWDR